MRARRSPLRLAGWPTAGLLIIAASALGCRDAEEFRSVAASSIQTGVRSIATGLIDGLFAVIMPDEVGTDSN